MYPKSNYRIGIVVAQDFVLVRARVTFPDHDNMVSWWLQIVAQKSSHDKGYWMPDVGDQVVCIMDPNDEDGAILGAVYSPVYPPPGETSPSPLKLTSDNAGAVSATPLTGTLANMFEQAAATCPALATAIPGVSGKNLLIALATTESNLNTNAVSQPARDGSRAFGIMQISTSAHPGVAPATLMSDTEQNIRIGTGDICGKMAANGNNVNLALAHYKGWGNSAYATNPEAQAQVASVTKIAGQLGES